MPPQSVDCVLGNILNASRQLMKTSSAFSRRSSSSLAELPIPDCVFPQPRPLTLDSSIVLDHIVGEKLSSVYLRAAGQLKSDYEKQFRRVCRGFIQFEPLRPDTTAWLRSTLYSTLVSEYTQRLNVWITQIKAHAITHARQKEAHRGSRRSFSQHAISVLESFFEHNAFPSRAEKTNLAADANITYPQVHIWFQNRRRRFRKEGKELKRSSPTLVLPSELETSLVKLLPVHVPESWPCQESDHCSCTSADVLNMKSPPHAFPSAYPPTCSYAPFPIDVGVLTFTTPWIRKPSSILTSPPFDVSIAQLTASFMRMALADGTQIDAPEAHPIPAHTSDPLGFTTITPRAPHPAFIPAARCIPQVKAVHKRKVPPLPKLMPASTSVAHCGFAPTAPEKVTRSSSSHSLSSSDASIASSSLGSASYPNLRVAPRSSPKAAIPQQTSSRRRVAALPKRALAGKAAANSAPPLPPPFISMSSRTPSASSSTSSGSSSPSGLDTPLSTPPSFSVPLHPSKVSTLFSEPSIDESSLTEGLQLQFEPTMRITCYTSS